MTTEAKSDSLARSINDRLSNLAKKQKVPFESLQSSFLLERMAARLVSDKSLAKALVFKGGFVSLRVYASPRYTNDLDALLRGGPLDDVRKSATTAIEASLQDGVWFQFEDSVDLATQGEYGGLRLIFRAGIGGRPAKIAKARRLNLDIGTGDAVTPGPVESTLPFLVTDGSLSWNVYPVETICSEKLHTLVVRGSENSRAKDVFDLSLFLPKCSKTAFRAALDATFKARGDVLPDNIADVLREIDIAVLKRGWKAAVAGIPESPEFARCLAEVVSYLERLNKA